MPKFKRGINTRLLGVILGISFLLSLILASVIPSFKPRTVRIVDNLFLGASVNLAASLYFRLRSSSEEKVQKERIRRREQQQKMKKTDNEALKRYDMFSLFATHFGWSSFVLFVLSFIGTILVT